MKYILIYNLIKLKTIIIYFKVFLLAFNRISYNL
jgi:hypothetical protein